MSTADRHPPPGHTSLVFELTGGRLALDFANTVDNRPSARRRDLLASYADLVAWGRQAAVLGTGEVRRLLETAARRPREARAALREAVALREAFYGICTALAAGAEPKRGDLSRLDAAARSALGWARLERTRGGFGWGWMAGSARLDRVLWPVARDAAEFLTSGEVPRLRECAAHDCGWLFLDASRNQSRVWCNMRVCGNRAKARRHYARSRTSRVAG